MNTEADAKSVIEKAAAKAEDVVQVAADKAADLLLRYAEEKTEAIAERAAVKAIDGFFIRLGVDTSEPLAMQKDFAYLRGWRESTEAVKRRGLMTIVTVLVTGGVGWFLATFWRA